MSDTAGVVLNNLPWPQTVQTHTIYKDNWYGTADNQVPGSLPTDKLHLKVFDPNILKYFTFHVSSNIYTPIY